MKASLYEYRDYKALLRDVIENDPENVRGKRKALADFIGCQVSHVTNVLSGEGHLNAEQAERASKFFGFSIAETEFLLLLIQFNRAATSSLKKLLAKLLTERQAQNSTLKKRLRMPDSLHEQEQARYYSSWQYAAVHVLISVPEFQNREALSRRLIIPLARIDEILEFLVRTGLCQKKEQKYALLRPQLHLDKDSPYITRHHTNWRLKSILELDRAEDDPLRYSSVFTVSKEDYPKVREIFAQALSEALNVITASPEETVGALCLDFFQF